MQSQDITSNNLVHHGYFCFVLLAKGHLGKVYLVYVN